MLLIRPIPFPNEHILSYLVRLTKSNGYKKINQLLRCCGMSLSNGRIPYKKIFMGEISLVKLANCCRITTKELRRTTCKLTTSGQVEIAGLTLPKQLIRFGNPRFCLECFNEYGYFPSKQLILPLTFCTKHSTALIDTVPGENQKISWSTPYLWKIKDDKDLINHLSVPDDTIKLNRYLDILFTTPTQSLNLSKLITFQLTDFLTFLDFIARYHQKQFSKMNFHKAKANNIELTNFYASAFSYIPEWPESFFNLLKSFEEYPVSKQNKCGIRACFSDFYDELYRREYNDSEAFKFLRCYFEVYLKEHFSNSPVMTSCQLISKETCNNSLLLNEVSTANHLGCSISRVKVFLRQNLLIPAKAARTKGNAFYRSDVDALKSKLNECLSIEQTSKYLGISLFQTRLLLRANIFEHILMPDENNRDWLIPLNSLKKTIYRLHRKSLTNPPIKTTPKTYKQLSFGGKNIITIIKGMLSNKQPFIEVTDTKHPLSLHQFKVCTKTNWQPNFYLSPKNVSKLLQVNINAIYDFIKLGLLEAEKCSTGRTARPIKLISLYSFNQFKSVYLLSHQIPKGDMKMFKVISGPKINGGVVKVYSKK